MDGVEIEFLKTQERTPPVWFRYMDDVFFIWNQFKEHLIYNPPRFVNEVAS